jgi:hypothetical protein
MVFFISKMPILVHFGRPLGGNFWFISGPFGMLLHQGCVSLPFGIFVAFLVQFFSFWFVAQRKIWQPCLRVGVIVAIHKVTNGGPCLFAFSVTTSGDCPGFLVHRCT